MSKSFPFLLASWQWSSNNPSHHLKPSYLTVLSYASNTQLFMVSKSAFLKSAGFSKKTQFKKMHFEKSVSSKNDAWNFFSKCVTFMHTFENDPLTYLLIMSIVTLVWSG